MWHRLRGRARHAPTARDQVDDRTRRMSAAFLVQLAADGQPEPMFCSVCAKWRAALVMFLSGNIEVSMCGYCLVAALTHLHDLGKPDGASRA